MAKALLFGLCVLALSCGAVREGAPRRADVIRGLKRVAIVIAEPGEFSVVYESARVAPPPLGLAGLAAVAAVDAARDRETTQALAARLDDPHCGGRFRTALERTLRESGRIEAVLFPDVESARRAACDAIAIFAIDACGFRRREGGEMAAFIDLSARLELPTGAVLPEEDESLIVPTRASRDRLLAEAQTAQRDLAQVLEDAGTRMANELLYP